MRAYRLAYDGRPFNGFQRQPDVPTVEGALLAALSELGVIEDGAAVPSGYAAAGRTDAGVSAVAQTVAFEAPEWCTPAAINGPLDDAVRAWASAPVTDEFHATREASRRTYVYQLPAPDVDLDRATAAAAHLSGEHDFHNLTPDDRRTVRDLAVTVEADDEFLVLTVSADGFPRQLVRRLVTLVDAVARGVVPDSRLDRVLSVEPLDGPAGVPPAPPAGLVLADVTYPGLTFAVDEDAVADARSVFTDRRWTARTRERTIAQVLDGLG